MPLSISMPPEMREPMLLKRAGTVLETVYNALHGSLNEPFSFFQLTKLFENQYTADEITEDIIYLEAKSFLQSTYYTSMGKKIPIDIRLTVKAVDYIRTKQK
jgi:hypothetical protein